MKTEVLEYRSPPASDDIFRPMWRQRFSFPISLALAIISLAAGSFASIRLHRVFAYYGPNDEEYNVAVVNLFAILFATLLLLIVSSAVIYSLALGKRAVRCGRGPLFAVLITQALAILLPIAVVLICGHRL